MNRGRSVFVTTMLVAGFLFLYLPIVLLIVYSFNESRLVTVWAGFSTKWYGELFRNEQVLDAAPLVADLLASVPELRVLATSRAPLHIRGEREYAVGPLALAVGVDAMSPADLARSPAVRLFVA